MVGRDAIQHIFESFARPFVCGNKSNSTMLGEYGE